VPIVRRERCVGVVCVQHVDPRRYEEVEIEALQTVAMVLSELIANAELVDEEEAAGLPRIDRAGADARAHAGQGLASGVAVYHQPRITIEHIVAEDTEAERQRVYMAFDKMRDQIDRMASQAEFGSGGEHDEVLETYRMFAYDEGWSRRINEAIDSGLTAEAAIERAAAHPHAHAPDRRSRCWPTACMIWRICPTACCASCRANWARRPAWACVRMPS
jgi:phosphotransferase system enzyme I (PtsP)